MSNDRIYLICKTCKDRRLLFKYYPTNGYVWDPGTLEAWMNEHMSFCHGAPASLGDDPRFWLTTEDRTL